MDSQDVQDGSSNCNGNGEGNEWSNGVGPMQRSAVTATLRALFPRNVLSAFFILIILSIPVSLPQKIDSAQSFM